MMRRVPLHGSPIYKESQVDPDFWHGFRIGLAKVFHMSRDGNLRFCSPSHVFLGVGRVASRQIFTPIKTTTKEVLVGQMMSRPNLYGIWTHHDTFLELWWLWTTRVLWGSGGTFRLPQPPTGVYQYDQLNTTEVLIWLHWCLPAGSGQLWNNRGE